MLVNHHHGAVTTLSSFSQTCHHMMLAGLIPAVLAFGMKTFFLRERQKFLRHLRHHRELANS